MLRQCLQMALTTYFLVPLKKLFQCHSRMICSSKVPLALPKKIVALRLYGTNHFGTTQRVDTVMEFISEPKTLRYTITISVLYNNNIELSQNSVVRTTNTLFSQLLLQIIFHQLSKNYQHSQICFLKNVENKF